MGLVRTVWGTEVLSHSRRSCNLNSTEPGPQQPRTKAGPGDRAGLRAAVWMHAAQCGIHSHAPPNAALLQEWGPGDSSRVCGSFSRCDGRPLSAEGDKEGDHAAAGGTEGRITERRAATRSPTGVGDRPQRRGAAPDGPCCTSPCGDGADRLAGVLPNPRHAIPFHHHGPRGHLDPPLSGDAGQMLHIQGQTLRDDRLICSWDLCVMALGPHPPRSPGLGFGTIRRASTSGPSSQLSSKRI